MSNMAPANKLIQNFPITWPTTKSKDPKAKERKIIESTIEPTNPERIMAKDKWRSLNGV